MDRSNLEIVFGGWLDALRRGDRESMRECLAPDVIHQGVKPDWVCRGREQVFAMAGARAGKVPVVEALELVAAGEYVVMTVRGPSIGVPLEEDSPPRGQACVVFTLRDGLIVHMQDYLHRADALAAANATLAWD